MSTSDETSRVVEEKTTITEEDRIRAIRAFGGKEAEPVEDKEDQVKQLFAAFMNKDGRIGYKEAKKYTLVTDGVDELPEDIWGFVCKWAGCEKGTHDIQIPNRPIRKPAFSYLRTAVQTIWIINYLDSQYDDFHVSRSYNRYELFAI